VYRDPEGWGNPPATSLLHAYHLARADDLAMGAIPVGRRQLKPHLDNRRGLEDPLRSKQYSRMTNVFRPCLKPFRAAGCSIVDRYLDRESFRPGRGFLHFSYHNVIPHCVCDARRVFALGAGKHSRPICRLRIRDMLLPAPERVTK
jgi:hypothetical protein